MPRLCGAGLAGGVVAVVKKTQVSPPVLTAAEDDSSTLIDFISGLTTQATPEEVQATQPFSKRLAGPLGYPKSLIRTRPQHLVRLSSSKTKSEPVDIAVFLDAAQDDDDLFMIVECKRSELRPTEDNGLAQLKQHMRNSAAIFGVWTNGLDTIVYRKVFEGSGEHRRPVLKRVAAVPGYVQNLLANIDNPGLKENLLVPTVELRALFSELRNHLAGNAIGMTRDDDLVDEVINLLLCKLYDERYHGTVAKPLEFRVFDNETPDDLKVRMESLLSTSRQMYGRVADSETIRLDAKSLYYFVEKLSPYRVFRADRDVIGDAFEAFIGPSLRGNEGQFFTPRNVIDLAVLISGIGEDSKIIDPACGSGGFLVAALESVWRRMEMEADARGWTPAELGDERERVAQQNFYGCDKDRFLAKITKAYMALMGDGRSSVYCANSLLPVAQQTDRPSGMELGAFDGVLTNPPYGKSIKVSGEWVTDYELGCAPGVKQTDPPSERPEILFIERCVRLVKPGGVVAMVLPEGLFAGKSYRYILDWLLSEVRPTAVITLPHETFKTSGKGGTRARTLLFVGRRKGSDSVDDPFQDKVFMAEPTTCGHDSRARIVASDEISEVAQRYLELVAEQREGVASSATSRLGTLVSLADLKPGVLIPRYYLSEAAVGTGQTKDHTVGELIELGVISVSKPGSVKSSEYDERGLVPFVRTTDITDHQVVTAPKKRVGRAAFDRLGVKSQATAGDILFIRDGEELIGRVAYVMKSDGDLLLQSHILRLRVDAAKAKTIGLDEYTIFAALASPETQAQIPQMRFTQSTIATVAERYVDLVLHFPASSEERKRLRRETKKILDGLDTAKRAWKDLFVSSAQLASVAQPTLQQEAVQGVSELPTS